MEHEIIAVWTQVAQVFATLLVGGVQCGLIWWGLKQIDKASTVRNRQLDQLSPELGPGVPDGRRDARVAV